MSEQSDDPDQELEGDGGIDVGGVTDGDASTGPRPDGVLTVDGEQVPIQLDDDVAAAVRERDDVDLAALADGVDGEFDLAGQADDGDGVTVPVHDVVDHNLTSSSRFDDAEFRFIHDDQIAKLEENGVTYTERVGDWILAKDDLVPGIKERVKSMIQGEGGMSVEPADPDSEADQNLADHLRDLYENDVRPSKVIDTILAENMKNARAVLRATDLKPLDLRDLQYVRDGISGEEIYWQDETTVTTFDVEDDGPDADEHREIEIEHQDVDAQPLVIGDQVFDIALYDQPPLEAVADTAVNKKVMQRLKARKAEITSFGGIVMKANPPEWLDEDEWFDRVEDDDFDHNPTKLERALKNSLENAHDWVKKYQSGTTGAIPMHWEIEQVEIPETDDPIDDQIRGYNKDISRRLLIPLDLIELREGAELSRETLFATLLTTIEGWRQEITRVFDQYADIQKEIHDVGGNVDHQFPRLGAEDEELIVQVLQFAGLAGLSENEVRQMLNQAVEGLELEIQDNLVEDGEQGDLPDDLQNRSDEMRQMLDDQRRGPDVEDEPEQPEGDDGEQPQTATVAKLQEARADLRDDGAIQYGEDGDPICWACGASASRVNVTPPYEYTCAEHGISPNHKPIGEADMAHAAKHFAEGDKVRVGDQRGVVSEVRTSTFEGPDGEEHDASEDSPVYVVATVDGAVAVPGDDVEADDWSTGQDSPEEDLADVAQATLSTVLAEMPDDADPRIDGTLSAGPTDWDYPPSWRKSSTPSRLILLDAWSSMGGQFDCGGDCCKGTMLRSGMSDRASDQFCAAMKDRVLMWEGWRRGGGSKADVEGSNAFWKFWG